MSDSHLPPKMQEAVKFIETWCLANSIFEFVDAMGWPLEQKSFIKASNFATTFRKNGIPLRKLSKTRVDLDFSYLKIVGERAMATLGRRKEDAENAVHDILKLHAEAARYVAELRKFRNRAIAVEALIHEGELTR